MYNEFINKKYMTSEEKSLKQILKEQREEYQRYLGVLLGSFTLNVQVIAETLVGAQK